MNSGRTLCVVMGVVFVLAVSTTLHAKSSGSMSLPNDATIGGTHLGHGRYEIKWEDNSPDTTVSFVRNKHVEAVAEAKVVHRPTPYRFNSIVYDETSGGHVIKEVRFQGSSDVLVFESR